MDTDKSTASENGNILDQKIWQIFEQSFCDVQRILDQNRILIDEISLNQESRIPENLTRNVPLIRELNNNILNIVKLYADLSASFVKVMVPSTRGELTGIEKANATAPNSEVSTRQKRIRSE